MSEKFVQVALTRNKAGEFFLHVAVGDSSVMLGMDSALDLFDNIGDALSAAGVLEDDDDEYQFPDKMRMH